MRKAVLYFIVCVSLLLSCSCSSGGGTVPANLLDIEFNSNKSLVYEGRTFYNYDTNDNGNPLTGTPAFYWFGSDWKEWLDLGTAKVPGEFVHDIVFHPYEYANVKACYAENGEIAALGIGNYVLTAEDKFVSIFDAEYMGLYGVPIERSNANLIIGPFRLADIADVDHCIPLTGKSASWDANTILYAYAQDAPGLIYRFRLYKDAENDRAFLGCGGYYSDTAYLVELYDPGILYPPDENGW